MVDSRYGFPIHDFFLKDNREPLVDVFVFNPLTVRTPVLDANFEPHRHHFFEVMYITGGQGQHIIDFVPYELKPPMLYFVSPGQVHFWELSERLEGCVFMFKEDFLVTSGQRSGEFNDITICTDRAGSPSLPLSQKERASLDPVVELLLAEHRQDQPSKDTVLRSYIRILLITIQRILGQSTPEANESSLVRRFLRLVSQNTTNLCDITSCASELGVSATHLRALVKKETGRSPGQIIRQEIAMEAKRLLFHTELTGSEIAAELKFEDPSYFSRFFKRETGMSPKTFRHQISEKYHL